MEVIHVVTAVIAAEGEFTMTTTQEQATTTPGATQEPKTATKPNAAPRKPRVAPSKPKSGKKRTPAKKGAKAPPKRATSAKAEGARKDSKTAKVLDLLKRPSGATLKELMKATGWMPHSVRGFISAVIGKKMRLTVKSIKAEDGERSYSVKA
jgi:Protein of unknown function (DUF3489)